jgi:hypothetical protein
VLYEKQCSNTFHSAARSLGFELINVGSILESFIVLKGFSVLQSTI